MKTSFKAISDDAYLLSKIIKIRVGNIELSKKCIFTETRQILEVRFFID